MTDAELKFLIKSLCLGEDEDADEEEDHISLAFGSLLDHRSLIHI